MRQDDEKQSAFLARALASRDEARANDDYIDAEVVHGELRRMLENKRAAGASRVSPRADKRR